MRYRRDLTKGAKKAADAGGLFYNQTGSGQLQQQPLFSFFPDLSLDSLFGEFTTCCSVVACAAVGALDAAILFGSDLDEPPQHELGMIDLQKKVKRIRIHKLIWIQTTAIQGEKENYAGSLRRQIIFWRRSATAPIPSASTTIDKTITQVISLRDGSPWPACSACDGAGAGC